MLGPTAFTAARQAGCRISINAFSTSRPPLTRHGARITLPPQRLPSRTGDSGRTAVPPCKCRSPATAAAAAAADDGTAGLGEMSQDEVLPPRNPLMRVLSFFLPFLLLLGFLLVVLRFPAARLLVSTLYRRYIIMGAPGARLVLILLAALVPVHRMLRTLLRPITLRLGLRRLRKEVLFVLEEVRAGRPLTDEELGRLEALKLPATGGRWDGRALRARLLQEAVQGALQIAQGAALGGPGLSSQTAARFLNGLGRALGLSDRRAFAVVRREVAAASRAILAAAELASKQAGAKSGGGNEALLFERRRLAAVAAAFPLNDGSAEAIELAASVRRVEIWAAAASG